MSQVTLIMMLLYSLLCLNHIIQMLASMRQYIVIDSGAKHNLIAVQSCTIANYSESAFPFLKLEEF